MNVEAYRAILQRLGVEPAESASRDKAEAVAPVAASVPPLNLCPDTVREVLGRDADDPHAVACLRLDVLAVVRRLEEEIATGTLTPGVRPIRGRPLADWLHLDDLARLLRAWGDRRARTRWGSDAA